MSYEDGPPEPTDEEMDEYETKQSLDKNPTVKIEGLTASDVRAVIAGLVDGKYRLDETAREMIADKAQRAVDALTEEVARDAIRQAVDDTIASGVRRYHAYNGTVESTTTIAELVHKELTRSTKRSYNDPERTVVQDVVAETVKGIFTKELQNELEKLKQEFRAQADDVFKAKIVAALKDAIGLRT